MYFDYLNHINVFLLIYQCSCFYKFILPFSFCIIKNLYRHHQARLELSSALVLNIKYGLNAHREHYYNNYKNGLNAHTKHYYNNYKNAKIM